MTARPADGSQRLEQCLRDERVGEAQACRRRLSNEEIGCAGCHVPTLQLDDSRFTVQESDDAGRALFWSTARMLTGLLVALTVVIMVALLVTLIDYRLIFTMMAVGTALAAVYLLTMLRGRLDTAVTGPAEQVLVTPASTPTMSGDPGPSAAGR